MKNPIALSLLAVSLVISSASIGRTQSPIIKTSGILMSLIVEQNGTIRNDNDSIIGNLQQDGTVRNANGSIVGNIQQDGTVRDADGSIVGNIHSNGTIRDYNDYILGNVQENGTVRDADGYIVDRVNGKKEAIIYFFFSELLEND